MTILSDGYESVKISYQIEIFRNLFGVLYEVFIGFVF